MNFLELHNKVLDRLREKRITSSDVGGDPYVLSIGAHINDAKDAVENAWNWSVNRGTEDIAGTQGAEIITIPNSADTHYILDKILVAEKGNFLRPRTPDYMDNVYARDAFDPVGESVPQSYAMYFNDTVGNLQVRLGERPDAAYTYKMFRTKDQGDMVAWDDLLIIPSLPVYTLAHALASKERGEVGGTPSTELFAIADSHLSDAIAMDSALRPHDTDWVDLGVSSRTNVRYGN